MTGVQTCALPISRLTQPHFANARSIRNALDRARLRQANRVFAAALGGGSLSAGAEAVDGAASVKDGGPIAASIDALSLISAADLRASRVFAAASNSNSSQ